MITTDGSSLNTISKDQYKTVLLVRHAKSSWDNLALSDYDRPLNERGKKDAPKMAKKLVHKHIMIDAFISSPAERAKKTAALFIKEFGRAEKEIILIPALYDPTPEAFLDTISKADPAFKSIAIFSHNPTITYVANKLIKGVQIDDMPTCSVFSIKVTCTNWLDFRDAEKEFWFFDYPKNTS